MYNNVQCLTTMKTNINKATSQSNRIITPPKLSQKRRALLEHYFTNALVLAALLESAQASLKS